MQLYNPRSQATATEVHERGKSNGALVRRGHARGRAHRLENLPPPKGNGGRTPGSEGQTYSECPPGECPNVPSRKSCPLLSSLGKQSKQIRAPTLRQKDNADCTANGPASLKTKLTAAHPRLRLPTPSTVNDGLSRAHAPPPLRRPLRRLRRRSHLRCPTRFHQLFAARREEPWCTPLCLRTAHEGGG